MDNDDAIVQPTNDDIKLIQFHYIAFQQFDINKVMEFCNEKSNLGYDILNIHQASDLFTVIMQTPISIIQRKIPFKEL